MDMTNARRILAYAKRYDACEGNYNAAARYLENDDLEGFERVCRGNVTWLSDIRADYTFTDGVAEKWNENGQLESRCAYTRGRLYGLYETWHENGQLASRRTYEDGKIV